MKRKHLLLGLVVVLATGAWWYARPAWRAHPRQQPDVSAGAEQRPYARPESGSADPSSNGPQALSGEGPTNLPESGRTIRPPEPNRRFTDFTPEERVRFARQGHGPGG